MTKERMHIPRHPVGASRTGTLARTGSRTSCSFAALITPDPQPAVSKASLVGDDISYIENGGFLSFMLSNFRHF
jgi:hypothetical protein